MNDQEPQKVVQAAATAKPPIQESRQHGGLSITDIKVGEGATAVSGRRVTVHYTGTLTTGRVFDSSRTRNKPFTFHLGQGEVIKGWDEGVVDMKVGGQRKLVIPPEMAYGRSGAGAVIPPDATLNFDIELISVEN